MDKSFNGVIKKHVVLAVLSVVAVMLMAGGVTYALFQIDHKNTVDQTVAVGTLDVNITSIKGGIVVSDLYPEKASEITDEDKKYNFTISNTGTYDVRYEVYLKDATDALLTSTTEYSEYKRIASEHYKYINYKLDGDQLFNLASNQRDDKFIILKGLLRAGASEDHSLQFFLDDGDTTETGAPNEINGSVISLDIYFDGGVTEPTIVDDIIARSNGVRTKFDEAATTDEGIFEMEDDYGTSYYYRGAVENNYVKFADYYWRIIRVNGDGSLRIMYDGTSAHANGEVSEDRVTHTNQAYNTKSADAKYVGWMYGPVDAEDGTIVASTSKEEAQTNTIDSDVKKVVEAWYNTNIEDKGYSSAVSDTLFCNDRSIPGQSSTGWNEDTGLGYGENKTAYGSYGRLITAFSGFTGMAPSFKCPQKNDTFTAHDTSKGNGKLVHPVGLITADEIMAAGSGKYGTANQSYYLYKGLLYWSMSPNVKGVWAKVNDVSETGYLGNPSVGSLGAVAPVINLSSEYVATLKGTGTMSDPYTA